MSWSSPFFDMLPQKARAAVERNKMFGPDDTVIVGVSGGPDSVALLYWLRSYAVEKGVRLHVAHLNHMLRGEAAEADARWVAALARDWGLPLTMESQDVDALRRERGLSLEDAARQARYSFFARVVATSGACGVAVGHTADDQVETVIHHWVRGAGLPGMRGMLPVTVYDGAGRGAKGLAPLRIFRPLLDVSRAEVEDFLRAHNLSFRVDESNLSTAFTRNRIRHELMPRLQNYNPRFKEAALRAARMATVDYDFIQRAVDEAWNRLASVSPGRVTFPLAGWSDLHPSIQAHLLRRAGRALGGDLVEVDAIHVTNALDVILAGRTGSVLYWPAGLRVVKQYDDFCVEVERPAEKPVLSPEGQALAIPGETDILDANWRVLAKIAPKPCSEKGSWHADLDYAKTGGDLVVRRRRVGDRFHPLGLPGDKKVQDYLVDGKVPRQHRDSVPIVATAERIVWLAGLRIDDRFKITPATRDVLCLSFEERSSPGPCPERAKT